MTLYSISFLIFIFTSVFTIHNHDSTESYFNPVFIFPIKLEYKIA